MRYKYFALSCTCSIEIRQMRLEDPVIIAKGNCPRCNEPVTLQYFDNICTPGYSDYEGEYLYINIKEREERE